MGEPAIEGYTNFLWTVFLGLGLRLGGPVVDLMVFGGLYGASLDSAPACFCTASCGQRGDLRLCCPLILAFSPHFAVASTNGLESSMFLASVLFTLWLTLTAHGRQRVAAGTAAGLLGLVRPEGWAVGALLDV